MVGESAPGLRAGRFTKSLVYRLQHWAGKQLPDTGTQLAARRSHSCWRIGDLLR
jgi:hypothetical protein